jgi:hypothetical protein
MPLEVSTGMLRIGFPEGSFFGRQAQSPSARESILKAAEILFGARPQLVIGGNGDAKLATVAELEDSARKNREAAKKEAALSHPRVRDAIEVFEESTSSVLVELVEQ